jgi:hypothetical protein
MKSKFLFLFVLTTSILTSFAQTQMPNAGFENWSGGNPDNWGNSDAIIKGITGTDPGGVEKETNAPDVYVGAASLRCKTDSVTIALFGQTILLPGVTSLGTISLNLATRSLNLKGIGYTDRPDSFSFAYKYTSGTAAADTGGAIVTLTKAVPGPNGRLVVGNAQLSATPHGSYIILKGKINYQSALAPDTLYIQLLSSASISGGVKGSTLWADDLKFSGLDTAFKAYIRPSNLFGPQDICAGDTVRFETDNIPGYTFRWLNNNAPIPGATFDRFPATLSGVYSVEVTNGSRIDTSEVVNVTVHSLPTVTLTGNVDTVCKSANAITLSGGTPAGGTFSGTGVTGTTFDPSAAVTANTVITYAYTDNNGCSSNASETIVVKVCTSIDKIADDIVFNLYPNPASSVLNIETDQQLFGTSIQVLDVSGKVISTQIIDNNRTIFNVSNFANGNYFFRVVNKQNEIVVNGKFAVTK